MDPNSDASPSPAPCDSILFLDFDYTLFSGNSTELFLLNARPRWLASVLIALIRDIPPWRLFSWERWQRLRDYALVTLIAVLSPWNLWRWRRDAAGLFFRHSQHALARDLAARDTANTVIVSFGFDIVIRPLLRESPWRDCRVIATPFRPRWHWMTEGKLALVRRAGLADAVPSATFVTDSQADADLLAAVRHGSLIERTGPLIDAGEALYFPLRYTANAKYPPDYVRDQTLFVDIPVALLASAHFLSIPAMLAVVLLFMSLMCIYEIGYFENDMEATERETAPTLPPGVDRYRGFELPRHAWRWAALLGTVGCVLASWPGLGGGLVHLLGAWLVILVAVRGLFWVYNRQRESARPRLYLGLQLAKYLPIPLLFGLTLNGAVLVLAQSIAMWIRYSIYRAGGDAKNFGIEEARFILVAAIVGGAAASQGFDVFNPAWLAIIAGWCLWRAARRPLKRLVRLLQTQRAD